MNNSFIKECREFFENSKKRADNYLKFFAHECLNDQFVRRRISKLVREPTLSNGFLSRSDFTTFEIVISIDDSIDSQLVTVGHELAHTFELHEGDLFLRPPYFKTEVLHNEIEDFCEYFAEQWLQQCRVKDELTSILRSKKKWKAMDCAGRLHIP